MLHTSGLHHLTAIASDPQCNPDFRAGRAGLRSLTDLLIPLHRHAIVREKMEVGS